MDKNKNIYQIESGKDESYIKLELDISGRRWHAGRQGEAPCLPRRLQGHRLRLRNRCETFDVSTERDQQRQQERGTRHRIPQHLRTDRALDRREDDTSRARAAAVRPARRLRPRPRRCANSVNLNPMGSGGDYFRSECSATSASRSIPARTPRSATSPFATTASPNNVLFHENLAAGHVQRNLCRRRHGRTPDSRSPNGRYVLCRRRQRRLRGPESEPQLDADAAHHVQDVRRKPIEARPALRHRARHLRGLPERQARRRRLLQSRPDAVQRHAHVPDLRRHRHGQGRRQRASARCSGEGWWSGLLSFGNIWNHFGDRQSLLAKLVVTYKDGTSDTITTNDRTWKYFGDGPLVYSSLDFGEVYDAAREPAVEGWTTAAYDDSKWKSAVVVPLEGTTFSGPEARPRRSRRARRSTTTSCRSSARSATMPACSGRSRRRASRKCGPACIVYDMGQNLVGVPRITIANGRAGRQDHAPVFRDAVSRSEGVGEERRHDHDGELSCRAEPGRLHDEGRDARSSSRASPRTDISTSKSPGSTSRCRWKPCRAWRSVPSGS